MYSIDGGCTNNRGCTESNNQDCKQSYNKFLSAYGWLKKELPDDLSLSSSKVAPSHTSFLPLAHFHFRICHPILSCIRLSNLAAVGNRYIIFLAAPPDHNPTITKSRWHQYVEINTV